MSACVVLWDGTNDPFAFMSGGLPTWRWRGAPRRLNLATRRQLRARGLSPRGGAVARIECRRGKRFAYLYRAELAVPVRPVTPAMARALAAALKARKWCPCCESYGAGCISKRFGKCLDCITDKELSCDWSLAA